MTATSQNKVGRPALLTRLARFSTAASLIFVSAALHASQSVSLGWNPSISVGVAGYTVYRGMTNGSYCQSYDAGTNLQITLTGLTEGHTNYFTVVAYNSARMEGTPAAQISYIVPGIVQFAAPAKAGVPAALNFPVAVGHSYQVQASTNLTSWATIFTTNSATANIWVNFQDQQSSQFSRRFYRLVMQ